MRWQQTIGLILSVATTMVAQEAVLRGRGPRGDRNGGIVPPGGVTRTVASTPSASATARGRTDASSATHPTLVHQRLGDGSPFATILARERLTICPTQTYWDRLPLLDQIQLMARSGFIPADPFPTDKSELTHWTMAASGWRAYGFLVPPGGQVRIDLDHPKPAWFKVFWTDKWGEFRPGMKMSRGNPSCLYENLSQEVQPVFCMVDDPGLWSTEKDPYTLKVTRSWAADSFDAKGVTLAAGIWATPPPVTAMR